MTLASATIPQADQLWDVARVPEAIDRGRCTTEAIAEYIGMKVMRQGHYYTQAARILGLVAEGEPGDEPKLTTLGRGFARSNRAEQRTYLRRLMFHRDPMRSVIAALRTEDGLDRTDLARVLQTLAPLADSTARRRTYTLAAWLTAVGVATWRDGYLHYTGPNLPMVPAAPDRGVA
ncbi:MAG: hypothetical protein WCG26_04950 [Chloroflexales bacterium]